MINKKNKRIGLFFGSFAPFHNGHLLLAKKFYRQFNLQEIRLVFTPKSPFKLAKKNLNQKLYISLLQKICYKIPFLKLDLTETKLKSPHYSFLTTEKIQKKFPRDTKFFFLVGGDNFQKFHLWYNFKFLLKNTHVVCYPRFFFNEKEFHIQKKKLIQLEKKSLLMYFLHAKKNYFSSTKIRKKINQRKNFQKETPSHFYYLLKKHVSN